MRFDFRRVIPAVVALMIFAGYCALSIHMPIYSDEGVWATIGKIWVEKHLPPVVGSLDNKNIGLYIIYALSHWMFGQTIVPPRIVGTFAITITALLVYRIGKSFFSWRIGVWAMVIFGLTRAWLCFEGSYPALTESYSAMFVTAAIWVLFSCDRKNVVARYFLAGLFVGLATSFRQTAVISFFTLWIASALDPIKPNVVAKSAMGFGFISVILGSSLLYLLAGVPWQMFLMDGPWGILRNSGNVQPNLWLGLTTVTDTRCLIFFAAVLILGTEKTVPGYVRGILITWFLFEFFAASATLRFWGHNFLTIIPAAAIIFAKVSDGTVEAAANRRRQVVMTTIVIVFFFSPYTAIINAFRASTYTDDYYILAQWIDKHSRQDEKLFVLAYAGTPISYLSQREIVSRHICAGYITNDRMSREVQNDLEKKKPDLIIFQNFNFVDPPLTEDAQDALGPIIAYVNSRYHAVNGDGLFTILRRNDTNG